MASLAVIRAALGAALATIPKLQVSPNLTEIQNLGDGGGASLGGPLAPNLVGAMGRGNVTWTIPIQILAPKSNYQRATEILDELVYTSGPRSIPGKIWDVGRAQAGGLGVLDSDGRVDVDAYISELAAYGVEFENAGIAHLGAVLNCVVQSPGYPT